MEGISMKKFIWLATLLLQFSSPEAFAQITISHVKGGTCAHSDRGEGACISYHSGEEAGGYHVDCELKQGSTSRVDDVYDSGMSVPTWTSASNSSLTYPVSYYASAPPNQWCVHHHGRYYDTDYDVFPGQTSPGIDCDVYGQ